MRSRQDDKLWQAREFERARGVGPSNHDPTTEEATRQVVGG